MSNINNKIFLEKGVAYEIVDGKRVAVDSLPKQDLCDCYVDCCLKAVVLPDHDGTGTKYMYILNGNVSVGTLAELKADSTIIK